jgi:hypothetical protein
MQEPAFIWMLSLAVVAVAMFIMGVSSSNIVATIIAFLPLVIIWLWHHGIARKRHVQSGPNGACGMCLFASVGSKYRAYILL